SGRRARALFPPSVAQLLWSCGCGTRLQVCRNAKVATVDRDAHQPAAVLAAGKDKPFGRPQEAAVLGRDCARQPRQCAGRDGRMAPPGAEPKNATKPEDNMT